MTLLVGWGLIDPNVQRVVSGMIFKLYLNIFFYSVVVNYDLQIIYAYLHNFDFNIEKNQVINF